MRRLGLFTLAALIALIALITAGFVGAVISGNLNNKSSTQTAAMTTSTLLSSTTTTMLHSSIHVLVANGTLTNGAAAHFTQMLQAQGWSTSTPTNTTSQASTSAVYYAPTKQAAAALIASGLGVKASAVQPLTAAAPVVTTTGIDVLVVIGPDLAGQVGSLTPVT